MGSPETRAEIAQNLRDDARQLLMDTGLFALLQDRFGEPSVTESSRPMPPNSPFGRATASAAF